ncbi:MAG: hypothetical protein EPN25_01735 [Nitrospirae bacterium]|nr:MAG: hypothetical protein EPN25_01735 [Nitrospirota bacterium]
MIRVMICLAVLAIAAGCGKKGPPTLSSFEKPQAPSQLTAVHRDNEMKLFWNFPKDKEIVIHNFILLRSSGQEFRKIAEPARESRSFSDRDFSPGQGYQYKIAAQNHKGVFSSDSNIIAVTPGHVPEPPDNLLFRVGPNSLDLQWRGPAGGLYNVYKSREKGVYGLQPLNKTPLSSLFFSDALDLGKTVYYTIRSLTDSSIRDESLPSSEITVDPHGFMPSPPAGLRAVLSSDRTYLFWDEPAERWVTGFRIYRRLDGEDYRLIAETQIPAFIDHGSSARKRDYRIHAVGPFSEGTGAELTGIAPVGDNDQKP